MHTMSSTRGVRRLENRVRRERRPAHNHAHRGAGAGDRLLGGIEDRETQVLLSARPASPRDEPGAIRLGLLRMKRALLAGKALTNDRGVLVTRMIMNELPPCSRPFSPHP